MVLPVRRSSHRAACDRLCVLAHRDGSLHGRRVCTATAGDARKSVEELPSADPIVRLKLVARFVAPHPVGPSTAARRRRSIDWPACDVCEHARAHSRGGGGGGESGVRCLVRFVPQCARPMHWQICRGRGRGGRGHRSRRGWRGRGGAGRTGAGRTGAGQTKEKTETQQDERRAPAIEVCQLHVVPRVVAASWQRATYGRPSSPRAIAEAAAACSETESVAEDRATQRHGRLWLEYPAWPSILPSPQPLPSTSGSRTVNT